MLSNVIPGIALAMLSVVTLFCVKLCHSSGFAALLALCSQLRLNGLDLAAPWIDKDRAV